MKQLQYILLFILPVTGFNQEIVLKKYDLTIQTSFEENERKYADSLFNSSDVKIFLVKLLPDCNERSNCFNESIIIDDFDWSAPVSDATFGIQYFKKVNHKYIDSASCTQVDSLEYTFFLSELLEGPRKLAQNEVIDICYNPRHAVIYKNELDTIIAIQEICFECGHTKVAVYTSEIRHNSSSPFIKMFQKYKLVE